MSYLLEKVELRLTSVLVWVEVELSWVETELGKNMRKKEYKNLIRSKCRQSAYEYLMSKRGSKGQEIIYTEIQTAEYLLPNSELDIEDQREIFAIRNRMVNIPSNFISREKNMNRCVCGVKEEMKHIYECTDLNMEKVEVRYEKIFNGTTTEQKQILQRFKENLKRRSLLKENATHHVILSCDPLPPCDNRGVAME